MKISFLVMQNTHQKLNTKIKLDRKILSDVQLKTFKLFIKKTCILFSLQLEKFLTLDLLHAVYKHLIFKGPK